MNSLFLDQIAFCVRYQISFFVWQYHALLCDIAEGLVMHYAAMTVPALSAIRPVEGSGKFFKLFSSSTGTGKAGMR